MNNLEEQIKVFAEEIVNRSDSASTIKKNILGYRNFLINTKLIDKNSDISSWLNIVINNSALLFNFRESFGRVDINAFIESMAVYSRKLNGVEIDSKHYGHYHSGESIKSRVTNDSCGVSVSNDSCGSSRRLVESSSCGCSSSSYTSRC
jgi:hypothetical protein